MNENETLDIACKYGLLLNNGVAGDRWIHANISAFLRFVTDIEQRQAAKHKAEVEELERQVAGLRKAAESASKSLGAFCADEGWGIADMQNMDNLDKALADTSETAKRHDARVFEAGWKAASTWSGRSDMLADIGSKAYLDAMAYELEGKK